MSHSTLEIKLSSSSTTTKKNLHKKLPVILVHYLISVITTNCFASETEHTAILLEFLLELFYSSFVNMQDMKIVDALKINTSYLKIDLPWDILK